MMQSVLAPHGPEADRIAGLAMLLFGGGTVILLLVVAFLALALRGPASARGLLASDRWVFVAGVVFPVVVLTALLTYGLWVMRSTIADANTPADVTIEVSGEQWWWRVAYVRPDGSRLAEANEIRLPVRRTVELVLTSPDVIHSLWIPALAGKLDMIPGRTNRLRFSVDRVGVYRGQCAEYCGGAHALMAFDVVAMQPEEFQAWLEPPPVAPILDVAIVRGRDLFISSGCGGCHAVRGTPAAGTIGPDLSRVGGRRSIAAAALPMDPSSLAAFITHGQRLKPGNLMPPFRIFSPEEIDAMTAYLASLK